MTLKKYVAVFGIAMLVLMGCNNDDDDSIVTISLNDIGEQAVADQEKLRTYLKTHFYNKEDFITPAEDFDGFVKFDTISGENAAKTPLMDEMGLDSLVVDFGDVAHTLYVLKHRVGVGQVHATVVDSVLLAFRGEAVYEEGFFDSTITPTWFDMTGSFLSGFKNGFKGSQGGSGAVLGAYGAPDFNDDFEIGAIFMPSGLGYFNDTASGVIAAYSSLIFSYKVYQVNVADHDGDGVVSKIEAIDENDEVDARDTDGDGVLDIFDTDDDDDGTLTIDEIEKSDTNGDGVINDDDGYVYPDTDGDNIPDYLDADTK